MCISANDPCIVQFSTERNPCKPAAAAPLYLVRNCVLGRQAQDLSSSFLPKPFGTRNPKELHVFSQLGHVFSDSNTKVRGKLFGIYGVLLVANVLVWL
ncbi:MAG: hypothetical protein CBARDMAM_3372 [uncultured Caballeronia sp.]|nr:MAG: hypothetical protein CBARDMAM_3372 [uncultured Caballeronia sp.]